jgi:WXG100 family type VII secretion target
LSNLQVEYSTLESSAVRADQMAENFGQQLNQLQATVMNMVWKGQSGAAFQGYFDKLKAQLAPVQETLHGLSGQIKNASRSLQESDAAVAKGFRS